MQLAAIIGFLTCVSQCAGLGERSGESPKEMQPALLSKEIISQPSGLVEFSVYLRQDETTKRSVKPFQFEVRLMAEPIADNDKRIERVLSRIPDILTHDRVGAPAAVRSACTHWVPAQGHLYIAIGKAIGPGIIINLFKIDTEPIAGQSSVAQSSAELVAVTEHHFPQSISIPKLKGMTRPKPSVV